MVEVFCFDEGFFFVGLLFLLSGVGDPFTEDVGCLLAVGPLTEDAGLLERRSPTLSVSRASIFRFFDGILVAIDAFFVDTDEDFRAFGPSFDGINGADGEDLSIDDALDVDPRFRS